MAFRLVIFMLALSPALNAQQLFLHGQVSIFNSEYETGTRQYLAYAEVEEDFGRSQPALTDSDGRFRLPLIGIPELTAFGFSVHKASYQVVNIGQLRAVAGQLDTVRLAAALPEKIAEYRLRYYQVSRQASLDALEEALGRLEQQIASTPTNTRQRDSLLIEHHALSARYEQVEAAARELAARYARVNLDDASTGYRQAFGLFLRGALDSALLVLGQQGLESAAAALQAEQHRQGMLGQEYRDRLNALARQRADTRAALLLKASLHQLAYEMPEAEATYELLLRQRPDLR